MTAPRPPAGAEPGTLPTTTTATATAPAGTLPDGASPVVEVRNLHKTYPGPTGSDARKVAVEDVSLTVAAGEIFGILGPNGAGKTTTVECVAGLREADGGTVRVLGVDPQAHPERVRDHVGVQLQESALNEKITVEEAMRLFASFYAEPGDVEELLALLDLAEHRRVAFAKLSGGQKQRLSIALALVGNPRVAILDELTTGLDPQARRATWDLVERVRDRGVTVLLVTHFMDEAERLCDRLVIIDAGRVVAQGSPAELIDALDDTRTVRLRVPAADHDLALHTLAGLADVRSIDVHGSGRRGPEIEVRGSRRVLPAVVLALAEQDVVPDDVRTVTRSLEDVFVAVTGRTYDPAATSGTTGAASGTDRATDEGEPR
ncbi:ABC transporter ATP-binding protein [Cellulosimicrobium marinum]|uniref:ABC transporter ATP-binding protein n=1 Tax=Cellulosimicrobium marinum TaxID=1638992 RepID=UPI001E64A745|nr:ABC transporter ATP-binding protein [Cellulosimicrobium marinum]MCB7136261.1 ABC transporter ATP-binding protein [Cellulosimicrobium marinum]